MSIANIKDRLGDYAKDAKVNISTVLTEDGAPGLKRQDIASVALAVSYSEGEAELTAALMEEFKDVATDELVAGAKAASVSMAMTNTYYKFLHLAGDEEIKAMPAALRMQVIGKPPVDKALFELTSLGVSIWAGCEMCIKAHVAEVVKAGYTKQAVQSVARITSVVSAFAQSLRVAT